LRSVRLTGGEPLVRADLPELVAMLAAVPGIDDISLSTNGLRLAEAARPLAAAGLRRVNVSLDTLREERFLAICRRPGLARVIAGIDAALAAGLAPVKLNCVVARGRNDDEISALAALTRERELHVRFIEMMPVAENAALQRAAYVSSDELLERLASDGDLLPVDGPPGSGPAAYYAFRGARGTVGVISPMSHDYCERCNRVRLSADGRLRLCLFGDHAVDLRAALRAGASREELADLFRGAMPLKPAKHHLRLGGASGRMRAFSEIGG
jgi:cyclic pyranopterin phosphate synthase